jgi:predicted dehydrogenase
MAKLRALLVGAGGMGRAWARNLVSSPDTEIVGWVDVSEATLKGSLEEIPLELAYVGTSLTAAIGACEPDFVVDGTPPEVHRAVTLEALAAGIPVLGEKPMAESMESAKAMVAAAAQARRIYMVSQSRRFDGRIQAFRSLASREIGPVGVLNADFFIGAHFGGFRDEMDSPLLLDMAIHTFDQARYLLDGDPVSVLAEEYSPSWSWYKGDACANALFEMTGGARFAYRGSWCTDGSPTSWEASWRAVGARGTVLWDGHGSPAGDIVSSDEGFIRPTHSVSEEPHEVAPGIAGSLAEFCAALREGREPMCSAADNIKSLGMVFAAIRSAREGRRVQIAEVLA